MGPMGPNDLGGSGLEYGRSFVSGKLAQQLDERGEIQLSKSTIDRLMSRVKKRCPVCKEPGRRHDTAKHLVSMDMHMWQQRVNEKRHQSGVGPMDII